MDTTENKNLKELFLKLDKESKKLNTVIVDYRFRDDKCDKIDFYVMRVPNAELATEKQVQYLKSISGYSTDKNIGAINKYAARFIIGAIVESGLDMRYFYTKTVSRNVFVKKLEEI